MKQRGGVLVRWIISITLLALAAWIFFNRQLVIDQFVIWNYQPSKAIEQLAVRTAMSERGTFLFYASQPELSSKQVFNKQCESHEGESVVLGCYTGQHIYIYNVSDKRLDGVKEVTAAHEMLHAAYLRLSDNERSRINALIEKEVDDGTTARLKDRLKIYEKTEPGQRSNELHSILGTEMASLSPELEAYYAQYFTKRSKVVALFEKYEGIFKALEAQQKQLVRSLEVMAAEIKTRTSTYNQQVTSLNDDIEAFNTRAQTDNGFASQEEFIAARATLVAKQQQLEAERTNLNERIAEFNTKRTQLESLNVRARDLQNSLDSTPAPVPSI